MRVCVWWWQFDVRGRISFPKVKCRRKDRLGTVHWSGNAIDFGECASNVEVVVLRSEM